MPKIDGIKILRQVKQHTITRTVPIVMMTSSKVETDIDLCYSLGANSFIVKPVEFETFAKAITNVGIYWLHTNQSPIIKPTNREND